jgi:hypothetical protein
MCRNAYKQSDTFRNRIDQRSMFDCCPRQGTSHTSGTTLHAPTLFASLGSDEKQEKALQDKQGTFSGALSGFCSHGHFPQLRKHAEINPMLSSRSASRTAKVCILILAFRNNFWGECVSHVN